MTEKHPPLADLPISLVTQRYIDQESMDRILRMIYDYRPDLFRKLAERERLDLGEYGEDFHRFLRDEVHKKIAIPQPQITTSFILLEARLRARAMYGIAAARD